MKAIISCIAGLALAFLAKFAERENFSMASVQGPRDGFTGIPYPVFFDGDVTNREPGVHIIGRLPRDPSFWNTYFNDFHHYTSGDWTITKVDGGAAGAEVVALVDGDGGLLKILANAADNDAEFLQKKGESFKFEAGKPLGFSARLKVSDATQSDWIMGLQITDTTPLDVTDGVFFQKDDGDANLDFHVEKNNTASDATAIATVVDDTFLVVGFYYDGVSKVWYGVNGRPLGYLATTNLVDDEELTVSFGIQNGEAVAKQMTVDYIYVAKYRG